MVIISNMEHKPVHCADCPICDEYDQCMLQIRWFDSWEEQHRNCPLQEVTKMDELKKCPKCGRIMMDERIRTGRGWQVIWRCPCGHKEVEK